MADMVLCWGAAMRNGATLQLPLCVHFTVPCNYFAVLFFFVLIVFFAVIFFVVVLFVVVDFL